MVAEVRAEEVLSRLDLDRRRAVESFRERVREQLGSRLRDLRLYGSTVRGEEHEESDIDVLVLVHGASWDDRDLAWHVASEIDPRIHPRVLDFERYHAPRSRATGFYKELRKESVRL